MTLRGSLPALALLSCALGPGGAGGEEAVPSRWAVHLEALGAALDRGDVAVAVREWYLGYAAALRTRTWLGLIEVGDAYLRIAEATAFTASSKPMARQVYLEALVQAKSQRSPEGALRAAEAFDRLGDRAVVEQCVRVAEDSARRLRNVSALHQVATARRRLTLQVPPEELVRGER